MGMLKYYGIHTGQNGVKHAFTTVVLALRYVLAGVDRGMIQIKEAKPGTVPIALCTTRNTLLSWPSSLLSLSCNVLSRDLRMMHELGREKKTEKRTFQPGNI